VFPVRYELNSYILLRTYLIFKGLRLENIIAFSVTVECCFVHKRWLSLTPPVQRWYVPSIYSCCFHLEHRTSAKHFVSFQFLNFRQSVGLLGLVISPSQGRYLHTEQTHTNIHASSGIRTHDSSLRASEDGSCLRSRATVIGDSVLP
jgi:hypothetical protein